MRNQIDRVERGNGLEILIKHLFRRGLAKTHVVRIITFQQDCGLAWYSSHEYDRLESSINRRQDRAPMSTGTVAHIGDAVRINIRSRSQQIDASSEIDY